MNPEIIVSKFGGTSLAGPDHIKRVIEIVQFTQRRFIVVSAPGKRNQADEKITDLLYRVARDSNGEECFEIIKNRYLEIVAGLGIKLNLHPYFEEIWRNIMSGCFTDYLVSRGEYLNGLVVAEALGFQFVDAADVICFDSHGKYDSRATAERFGFVRRLPNAVIPGFYGAMPNGEIKTFSRGGSDVTGAIVAMQVGAKVYENWTDVSGILMADPRVVKDPKKILAIAYDELRELTYMGASVLHEEAVFPVREAGIPINVRNTNDPKDDGTWIVSELRPDNRAPGSIIGIAGRRDFTIVTVAKMLMNQEVGFARKICTVLEKHGVSFEHMPSGIDSVSVVIADRELTNGKLEKIKIGIEESCSPGSIKVSPEIALVCVVGQKMAHTPGVAAKVFRALADARINVCMINQGSSEINIIIGVNNSDYESAVRAIYQAFLI